MIVGRCARRRSAVCAAAVRSLLAAGLLCLALMVAGTAPARAHGRAASASDLRTTITQSPAIPGVTWQLHGGDGLLSVTNRTAEDLVVLGSHGEPYLRVGPEGVFENVRSPAVHLDDHRLRADAPGVDASAAPRWRRLSGGSRARWHDHRVHRVLPERSGEVAGATQTQASQRWVVPVRYGGIDREVVGTITRVGGPQPWPWLAVGLVLTAPAILGLSARRSPQRPRAIARPAALVLGAVASANLIGLVDELLAVPVPVAAAAAAAVQTVLFVGIGILASVKGWQAGPGAFAALGVGAASILLGQGLAHLPALHASQLATLLPEAWTRLLVAVSVTQALWVGAAVVAGSRASNTAEVGRPR